jgi:hypothetical protein
MVNLSRKVVPVAANQPRCFCQLAVVPMFDPVVDLVSVEISRQ